MLDSHVLPILIVVAIVLVIGFVLTCYKKAPPTEAVVVTGIGHKEPKVVSGKGVFVIPFLQRSDTLNMRVLKLDVKTPNTGVKTKEGVPVWVDSVVTAQVFSENSTVSETEWKEAGAESRQQYIQDRQQAAISNFLGLSEEDIDFKINDVLQGNLREIIGELSVEEALTARKNFAARVLDNARPDLAKLGMEVVTFNIQEIRDAVDSCGESHGVIEAIGVEKEVEVKKRAEQATANADRDIAIARASARKDANDAEVASQMAIAEKNNDLALRKSELKAQADRAAVDAEAASKIQEQIRAKDINEQTLAAAIAKSEKEVTLNEVKTQVRKNELDAEKRNQADADLYEQQKQAEAIKYAKQQEAAGVLALAEAEAEAIRKKGLAEADAMKQKAEAYKQYGDAAIVDIITKILPDMAANVAEPLSKIGNITIYGGDNGAGVDGVSGNVPSVLARTFDTVKSATGIDLTEIVNGESYGAKVNRNIVLSGDGIKDAASPVKADR